MIVSLSLEVEFYSIEGEGELLLVPVEGLDEDGVSHCLARGRLVRPVACFGAPLLGQAFRDWFIDGTMNVFDAASMVSSEIHDEIDRKQCIFGNKAASTRVPAL